MPEPPSQHSDTPRDRRLAEYALTALFLLSFPVLLLRNYSMKVWSDPVHWFTFGTHFPERFATSGLAYGFPLLVHLATRVLDPYHAFLVNIPVLVLLLGVFIAFAAVCARGSAQAGWTGLAAAGLFVILNKAMLVEMASPYRDPLAFLFMLTAALLFILHFEAGRPRWALLALSGLCLAYAVSCRETSGLLAAPLLLYAAVARYRAWDRRFWLGLAWFGLFLFLGCLPWLVQNYLVSGNPVVPSQSAKKVEQAASLLGMLPPRRANPHVLPTLAYLWDHYTAFGAAAAGIGLVAAIRANRRALYLVCAPAAVVYFLFYMLYIKIVPRYLLVIDLFVLPLAAYGAMATVGTAVSSLRSPAREVVVKGAAAALTLGMSVWMLTAGHAYQRFLPVHARAFVEAADAQLEPGAIVLCQRPVEGLLQCFSHTRARVLRYLGRHRVLQDPTKWDAIGASLEHGPAYLASMHDSLRRYVERQFDLDEELALDTRAYHLDEWFAAPAVRFDRIRPWSKRQVSTLVEPGDEAEPRLLEVDLGRLSAYDRGQIGLSVDGVALDDAPRDNMNYYVVPVAEWSSSVVDPADEDVRPPSGAGEETSWRAIVPDRRSGRSTPCLLLQVTSDGPLPRVVHGRLLGAGEPLVINLRGDQLVPWRDRFSEGWLARPRDHYPSLAGDGSIVLPSPGTNDWAAAFQFRAQEAAGGNAAITLRTDDGALLASARVPSEGWTEVPVFLAGRPDGDRNRVLRVEVNGSGAEPRRAWLRRIVLEPLAGEEAGRRIEVGHAPGDLVHLGDGFYDAERGPDGAFRWMAARATAHFFVSAPESEMVFSVTYRDPHPPGVPPAELACILNGDVLRTTRTLASEDGLTWSAMVPPSLLRRGVNEITVGTRTWVPAEELPGNRDTRRLGIQVRELRLGTPNPPGPVSGGSTGAAPG